jgi:hypothetical protein
MKPLGLVGVEMLCSLDFGVQSLFAAMVSRVIVVVCREAINRVEGVFPQAFPKAGADLCKRECPVETAWWTGDKVRADDLPARMRTGSGDMMIRVAEESRWKCYWQKAVFKS